MCPTHALFLALKCLFIIYLRFIVLLYCVRFLVDNFVNAMNLFNLLLSVLE